MMTMHLIPTKLMNYCYDSRYKNKLLFFQWSLTFFVEYIMSIFLSALLQIKQKEKHQYSADSTLLNSRCRISSNPFISIPRKVGPTKIRGFTACILMSPPHFKNLYMICRHFGKISLEPILS
jgi:hypothetical protein